MKRRLLISFALSLLVSFVDSSAFAAPSDASARAQSLFEAGKKEMDRHEYVSACADFEASLAAESGIGARLWLADCYESLGRTASASREFTRAADDAGAEHDAREQVAKARARSLEPRLIRLKIVVAAAERATTKVELDGRELDDQALDRALAVDPGKHVVRARSSNAPPWELVLDTGAAGSSTTIEVPAHATALRPEAPLAPKQPPLEAPRSTWGARRIGAVVVVGSGLVAAGIGTAFGARASSDLSASNRQCNAVACTQAGHDDRLDARRAANVATALFVGAGAAIGVGAVLFFTGKPTSAVSVSSGSGRDLRASFSASF